MQRLRCAVLVACAMSRCAAETRVDVAILLTGAFRGFLVEDGWATWAQHAIDVLAAQHLRAATWLCTLEHEAEVNATVASRLGIVDVHRC
jgi:hypothetical protein